MNTDKVNKNARLVVQVISCETISETISDEIRFYVSGGTGFVAE